MYELPVELKECILRIFGEQGQKWIEEFPNLLARCQERWNLTLGQPLAGLSINYLINAALPNGESVILKMGVPHREIETEIESLRIWQGRGIVKCVDADLQLSAMLLEKIAPGYMLTTLRDNKKETEIAAGIMQQLAIAAPSKHNLPYFAEWVERAFARYRNTYGNEGPMPRDLIEACEQAFKEIEETKQQDVLLHGDLHHENILFDERRGWLAIDPKGAIGDPCLEVGRYLHNQLPNEMPLLEKRRIIEERVGIFSAELSENKTRVLRCALIDHVLSLCWSTEDSYVTDDWRQGLAVAQLFAEMTT